MPRRRRSSVSSYLRTTRRPAKTGAARHGRRDGEPTRAARPRRDLEPTCTVRLYIGSGIPRSSSAGRYSGLPTSFDSRAFRAGVERRVGRAFPGGATYFKTRGVWKGDGEDGLMVEVIAPPSRGSCRTLLARAKRVAHYIARDLGQEAVFVVATDAEGKRASELVTAAKRAA